MKHKNEDISRLDGDIYQLADGTYVGMGDIIGVSPLVTTDSKHIYLYYLHCGEFNYETHIDLSYDHNIDYDDNQEKLHNTADKYRKEFIEVWKHWRRENARRIS